MSKLDQLYRKLLLTKYFVKGWGDPDNLKRIFEFRRILSCRDTCKDLVDSNHPIVVDEEKIYKNHKLIEGHFRSPLADHLPGIMPKECETAKFQMMLPNKWNSVLKPVCIHLAGTGDHYFWRRRTLLAQPLLKESGIASIILENPYYGFRKPRHQMRSSLHNVSDLFVMGGALMLESLVLLHWCSKQGLGPLGITGISMGGHMASLAATNWHSPIVLVPCLSWSTASVVFTEGVMSGAIPWSLLKKQYMSDSSYNDNLTKLIQSPEKHFGDSQYIVSNGFETFVPKNNKALRSFFQHFRSTSGTGLFQPSSTSALIASSLLNSGISSRNNLNSFECSEALAFMRSVMDNCTHLGNFSKPIDTDLIIAVVAESDAYYPRSSVIGLDELWPGIEVRHLKTGHISAFLFKQKVFRRAIEDAFKKCIEKYYKGH